jgi:hypothetical protein
VDFVLVGVGNQLVEQVVGAAEFEDLVGGQERGADVFASSRASVRFYPWLGGWGRSAGRAIGG